MTSLLTVGSGKNGHILSYFLLQSDTGQFVPYSTMIFTLQKFFYSCWLFGSYMIVEVPFIS